MLTVTQEAGTSAFQIFHRTEIGYLSISLKCDYRGRTQGGLKKHTNAVHEGITHDCYLCDYKASFKENLYRHLRTTHKQGTKFTCHECQYVTYSESSFQNHTNSNSHSSKIRVGNTCQ